MKKKHFVYDAIIFSKFLYNHLAEKHCQPLEGHVQEPGNSVENTHTHTHQS